MKKARLRTLLVALIPGPVLALTSVHLGNSLSAQCYDNFAHYARQKGKTLTTINAGGRFVAGYGLGLYGGGVSINRSCDVFIPQTYCNGGPLGVNAETGLITNWFKQALSQNPNCELYIFNEYRGYTSSFSAFQTFWTTTAPDCYYCSHDNYSCKGFHDSLFSSVKRANPGKKVYLLPVANVLFEAMKLMNAKLYPGIADWKELYSGLTNGVPDPSVPVVETPYREVHFGPKGMYMQMCIQYVCLFKEKPHDGPIANFPQPNNGSLKFSVPQDFAKATWDLVWNFCVSNSAMTGVTGTPVNTVDRFSVAPVPDRQQGPLPRVWLQDNRQRSGHTTLSACSFNGTRVRVTNNRAATGLYLLSSPVELRPR